MTHPDAGFVSRSPWPVIASRFEEPCWVVGKICQPGEFGQHDATGSTPAAEACMIAVPCGNTPIFITEVISAKFI
jgi:hypothetical protein